MASLLGGEAHGLTPVALGAQTTFGTPEVAIFWSHVLIVVLVACASNRPQNDMANYLGLGISAGRGVR